MINFLFNKSNDLLRDNYLFLIIFIGTVISIIKINFLPFSLTIDSYGYLEYADNLLSRNDWQSRPIGYPIYLKLTRILNPFGYIFVIFFQLIIYVVSSALLYLTFRNFKSLIYISSVDNITPSFYIINRIQKVNIFSGCFYNNIKF